MAKSSQRLFGVPYFYEDHSHLQVLCHKIICAERLNYMLVHENNMDDYRRINDVSRAIKNVTGFIEELGYERSGIPKLVDKYRKSCGVYYNPISALNEEPSEPEEDLKVKLP